MDEPLAEFAKGLFARKHYDYWVARALAEQNPRRKVEYLSKALALDPSYLPAWGLKATALFNLERYEEALACFDKVLQQRRPP